MMAKLVCVLVLLAFGGSLVEGQITAGNSPINSTLSDIADFRTSTLNSLTRSYNNLRDDVYGHFFRSQTTLRIARQNLFSTASKFPYYLLNETTRQQLVQRLTNIISVCIDPTVEYLQVNSMLRYFNFMNDSGTPIENALKPALAQLVDLETALKSATDSECINKISLNRRKLSSGYNPLVNAIGDCVRNASSQYRAPINEFTRVHFVALPLINRMNTDLNQCGNGNRIETCISGTFLIRYCDDETKCQQCTTITAVKTQAETMVNTTQGKFDECLKTAQEKLPQTAPLIEEVKKCAVTPAANNVV